MHKNPAVLSGGIKYLISALDYNIVGEELGKISLVSPLHLLEALVAFSQSPTSGCTSSALIAAASRNRLSRASTVLLLIRLYNAHKTDDMSVIDLVDSDGLAPSLPITAAISRTSSSSMKSTVPLFLMLTIWTSRLSLAIESIRETAAREYL